MKHRDRENSFGLYKDDGTSMIEAALLTPVLLLMFAGAIDLGKGFYIAIEVASAAQSGALYGVQNPSDTTGMIAAAKLDAVDVNTMNAVAGYGCECSDGGSVTPACEIAPSCVYNVVDYVEVDTSANYSPLLPYPGVSGPVVLRSSARMRAAH